MPKAEQTSRISPQAEQTSHSSLSMSKLTKALQDALGTAQPTHPDSVPRGPRGGDLLNPHRAPQYRNSPFTPSDGHLGLHRSPLFKDTAIHGIAEEVPWHRMAAMMLTNGATNLEVAQAAGVKKEAVAHIRGNRWFQELMATLETEKGQAYSALLQGEAVASLEKVIELRDTAENPKLVLQAATWLAEQAHGKAIQRVEVKTQKIHASPQDELQSINEELENLRRVRAPAKPGQDEPHLLPSHPESGA